VVDLSLPGSTGGSTAFSIDTGTTTVTINNVVDQVFTEGNDSVIDLHNFANDPRPTPTGSRTATISMRWAATIIVILFDTADALTRTSMARPDAGAGNDSVTVALAPPCFGGIGDDPWRGWAVTTFRGRRQRHARRRHRERQIHGNEATTPSMAVPTSTPCLRRHDLSVLLRQRQRAGW
jgi:hypothetical protein